MTSEHQTRTTMAASPAAWIGAQLGCTLWIVLMGLDVQARTGSAVGGTILTMGLVANVFGYSLWRRRLTLGPARATLWLILDCGLAALLSLGILDLAGISFFDLGYLPEPEGAHGFFLGFVGAGYPLLLVYPLLAWQALRAR